MAIFVSYSRVDADFVNVLATWLVKNNANVWIDKWELNVGDSLIDRIQNAIENAGALLVVLSKASVESEWCKKELNAGLIRELEEKRVVVLPVLKEDCNIPVFLRDKLYADFRTDFEEGFRDILAAIAKVTNPEQGRIRTNETVTDWGETWGLDDEGLFHVDYELVESYKHFAFIITTAISVVCNDAATRRYKQYDEAGLDWYGRQMIAESLALLSGDEPIQVYLEDTSPKIFRIELRDKTTDRKYFIIIRCRRLGEDNGKDQLVTVSNYFQEIADYVRSISRKPTRDELFRLAEIFGRN
jgi:hypothetical protein